MRAARNFSEPFRRVRQVTWRRIRWWLLALAISMALFFWLKQTPLEDMPPQLLLLSLLTTIVMFLSAGVVIFRVRASYRCPRCKEVLETMNGVPLNPASCPKCGAMLRAPKPGP
jgi:DNA-directed RNA polymerase subunit RPC12/RpoP